MILDHERPRYEPACVQRYQQDDALLQLGDESVQQLDGRLLYFGEYRLNLEDSRGLWTFDPGRGGPSGFSQR